MGKLRDFLEDVRDFALIVAAAPSALKVGGSFVQGISTTIAQPKVAQVVYKGGQLIKVAGMSLGRILKAGTTAVARTATPVVTTVAKSIPGSKLVAPFVKYIPTAAVAATSVILANKARNIAQEITSIKSNAIAKLSSDRSKFNILDPSSWLGLVRDAFTFK